MLLGIWPDVCVGKCPYDKNVCDTWCGKFAIIAAADAVGALIGNGKYELMIDQ